MPNQASGESRLGLVVPRGASRRRTFDTLQKRGLRRQEKVSPGGCRGQRQGQSCSAREESRRTELCPEGRTHLGSLLPGILSMSIDARRPSITSCSSQHRSQTTLSWPISCCGLVRQRTVGPGTEWSAPPCSELGPGGESSWADTGETHGRPSSARERGHLTTLSDRRAVERGLTRRGMRVVGLRSEHPKSAESCSTRTTDSNIRE